MKEAAMDTAAVRHSRASLGITVDVAVIAAILALSVPRAFEPEADVRIRAVVFSVALTVPLIWRRRAPWPVFLTVAAIAFVQWLLAAPVVADFALLIAFYTVAATSTLRRTLAAGAVLEFGVVLAVARYARTGLHPDIPLGLLMLSGLVTAAGVLGANVRVRAAYLAEVEQRAARLEVERDQQGRLAAAAERARIAREIHDIVAHNLAVMIALGDGASFAIHTDPERAGAAIIESSSVGRAALGELRRALGVLREDAGAAAPAPAPRISDLDDLLPPVRRTGLRVRLTYTGPVASLSPALQLCIYRLVQESLTNTVKHAVGADEVSVRISTDPDGTDVLITDNGAAPPASTASGHGIIGMRERGAAHDGAVEVGPTPSGWRVHARFPGSDVAEPAVAALA